MNKIRYNGTEYRRYTVTTNQKQNKNFLRKLEAVANKHHHLKQTSSQNNH